MIQNLDSLIQSESLIATKQKFYSPEYVKAITEFMHKSKEETIDTSYIIKKRTVLIFLLLYATQLDIEDILSLKIHDLKNILKKGYTILNYTKENKKKYLLMLNDCINIKDFDFLYNDLINFKKDNHFLFSSILNPNQKLRKKNILMSVESYCVELENDQSIEFNFKDFINSNIFQVVTYPV